LSGFFISYLSIIAGIQAMNTDELTKHITAEKAEEFHKDLIKVAASMPMRKRRGLIKAMKRESKKIEIKILKRDCNDSVTQDLTKKKRINDIKIQFMRASLSSELEQCK